MTDPTDIRALGWSVLPIACATALAFSPDAYLPMLARAFLMQWCLLFLLLVVLFALRRRWWLALGSLCGALLLIPSDPLHRSISVHFGDAGSLRVLHMNVLQPNEAYEQAIAQALRSDADVISVQELSPQWADAFQAGLKAAYPYAHVEPRSNCYGIALFSKRPFRNVCTLEFHGAPFIEAVLDIDGRPVRLLAVHATSPITYTHFKRRNGQLDGLARRIASSDTTTVLVGDLNTVPWDDAFERFCFNSGLRPASGAGQRTWPSIGPLALIPLDHLLISDNIVGASVHTIPILGSDHRGLLAQVQLHDDAR